MVHRASSCFAYAALPYHVAFDRLTYSKEEKKERERKRQALSYSIEN